VVVVLAARREFGYALGFMHLRFLRLPARPPRTFHGGSAQAGGRWHVGRDCLVDHLLLVAAVCYARPYASPNLSPWGAQAWANGTLVATAAVIIFSWSRLLLRPPVRLPEPFTQGAAQAWARLHVGRGCFGDHLLLGPRLVETVWRPGPRGR
jgi:hypothetical protein